MPKAHLTLLFVSTAGRGGGPMVVEAGVEARVLGQHPGRVRGAVGDRDKPLEVWNRVLVRG